MTASGFAYDQLYMSNYLTIGVTDRIAGVEGVGDTFTIGQQDYSMRVWLDPDKLQAHNLAVDDVIRVLHEQNVQVASGQIGQPPVPTGQDFRKRSVVRRGPTWHRPRSQRFYNWQFRGRCRSGHSELRSRSRTLCFDSPEFSSLLLPFPKFC